MFTLYLTEVKEKWNNIKNVYTQLFEMRSKRAILKLKLLKHDTVFPLKNNNNKGSSKQAIK